MTDKKQTREELEAELKLRQARAEHCDKWRIHWNKAWWRAYSDVAITEGKILRLRDE